MKKIKMTAHDKEKGYLAGLVYEMPDKQANIYLDAGTAREIKKAVKDGNR